MEAYFQTGLGIIVSVILFLIGYRQTIGARRERIKNANTTIVETILRRLILDKYKPTKDDINRIIEGKARDFKVKARDLLNVENILNTIYTRIFENDLISHVQREENLERLYELFKIEKETKESKGVDDQIYEKSQVKRSKVFNYITLMMGVVSSVIGVLIVSFDKLVNLDFELNSSVILTLIGSMITIIIAYTFLSFKDNQESSEEETPTTNRFKEKIEFEKEVINVIDKLNVKTTLPPGKDLGFDIIVVVGGKEVAIEIKNWRQRPPFAYIQQVIQRLSTSMEKQKIEKGLIVAKNTFGIAEKIKTDKNISLVDINELKRILK